MTVRVLRPHELGAFRREPPAWSHHNSAVQKKHLDDPGFVNAVSGALAGTSHSR